MEVKVVLNVEIVSWLNREAYPFISNMYYLRHLRFLKVNIGNKMYLSSYDSYGWVEPMRPQNVQSFIYEICPKLIQQPKV